MDGGCEGVGGRAGEERRRGGRRRRRRGREPRRRRRAPWCWRKRIEEAELVEEKVELPTRMRRQVRTRGGGGCEVRTRTEEGADLARLNDFFGSVNHAHVSQTRVDTGQL